jgi:hypothetical protein
MATTGDVRKPDHGARRGHFIFTEEHEALRESIRAFVLKELAPHADEWEETTFPDWVFRRMGELGFLGLDKPERYGGQGGDYPCSLVLAEELVHARSGGMAMGIAVHTDMTMPPILAFGTEEQKQEWLVPAIAGTKILCLGITEPDAGSDVAAIKTRAVRADDGSGEYVINGSKTYITNGHSSRRRMSTRDTTGSRCFSSRWTCRAWFANSAWRSSACTLRTRRCWPSTTCACRRARSSARSARASTTSCGSCRASG